jgi:hypothetical protein
MTEDVLERLRRLDARLVKDRVNRHDRAHMLINACITEGIDTGPVIITALVGLGFDGKHVGLRLHRDIRIEPVWPDWGRHESGQYFAPDMPADVA